jgi:hypothetical protein
MNDHERQSEHSLETLLSESVRSAYDGIPVPDGDGAWRQLQAKMQTKPNGRRGRKVFYTGTAAACLLLLAVLLAGRLDPAFALSNLYYKIKKHSNGFTTITSGNHDPKNHKGAKTAPPPENSEEPVYTRSTQNPHEGTDAGQTVNQADNSETVTLEEARRKVDFPLRIPSELPDGFAIREVRLWKDFDHKYRMEDVEYRKNEEDFIHIMEQSVPDNLERSKSATFFNQDAVVKNLEVDGTSGVLVLSGSGNVYMDWTSREVNITIHAKLDEEQAVKLARSLK